MLGRDPRPKLWHFPPLLFFATLLIVGVAVVLANRINSAFKVGEDFVILSVIGLVILTAFLELA